MQGKRIMPYIYVYVIIFQISSIAVLEILITFLSVNILVSELIFVFQYHFLIAWASFIFMINFIFQFNMLSG